MMPRRDPGCVTHHQSDLCEIHSVLLYVCTDKKTVINMQYYIILYWTLVPYPLKNVSYISSILWCGLKLIRNCDESH